MIQSDKIAERLWCFGFSWSWEKILYHICVNLTFGTIEAKTRYEMEVLAFYFR